MLNWLFLDMNSFFAACEQHDDPGLRGRPVGVCPVLAGGGAVIAASHDAKRLGVRVGTKADEARRLCPGIEFRQARPKRYVQLHRQLIVSIEKHAPITKAYSIDEWAVRLLGRERQPAAAAELGRRMMDQVRDDFEDALPCSVGIAASRMLAKAACDLHKPRGLTVLPPQEMPAALAGLALGDLPGIGKGMAKRLEDAGIHDVPALHAITETRAREIWGSVQGRYFWRSLHGHDDPEPATRHRSVGHGHMLPPEHRTDDGARAIMVRLLSKAAMRIRASGHLAHGLHARVTYTDDTAWSDFIDLPASSDTHSIVHHFDRLWSRRPPTPNRATPRKVGVDLSRLQERSNTTGNLFTAERERPERLSRTIDAINRKLGAHSVHSGGMTSIAGYGMEDKIAFGRIPDGDIAM